MIKNPTPKGAGRQSTHAREAVKLIKTNLANKLQMSTLPQWAQDHCAVMPSQSREEWLTNRMQVITGTEISAIMGHHPYQTRFDLWLQKTGQARAIEDNEAMRIGRVVEPGLRMEAEQSYGEIIDYPYTCLQSKRWPVLGCTPDGLSKDIPRAFEFKTSGIGPGAVYKVIQLDPDQWGQEMSDMVPLHYYYQCQAENAVSGSDQCVMLAMIANHGIRQYVIDRDEDIISEMAYEAEKFWRDHIEGGEQPDIEYSSEAESWIKRRFPNADKSKIIEADKYLSEKLDKLAHYKAEIKDAEAAEKQIRIEIMELMGDAYKLTSEYGSVTMPEVKGRTSVDWNALTEDLKISEDDIARYTRQGKPSRQFRFTPSKK